MKTNGTRTIYVICSLILVSLLITISGMAQPDYRFRNPTLVSGTDKQVGAKYLYKNVRSGTDAFVTITDISKVTLSELDGPSGYNDAFQPYIYCPKKTKGYVEFRFDFVYGGTSNPRVMVEIPVTAIDIDGYIYPDEKVYEFDEFDLPPTYLLDYDMIGSALDIKNTGTMVRALNKTAVDYAGIDTVKRDVMFTMIYSNVSSITIRAGVDNKSKNNVERLRSDYFQRFTYPYSFLAKSPLLSFRGNEKNNKVNLEWGLSSTNLLNTIIIEKATTPNQFQPIGEVWPGNDASRTAFKFTDNTTLNGTAYYRLKMVVANGNTEYSNILVFRSASDNAGSYTIYPNVIQSSTTISVKSYRDGSAVFCLVDYSGRTVMQRAVNVQEGNNNIVVDMNAVRPGSYVAVLKTSDNLVHSQKIVKQ